MSGAQQVEGRVWGLSVHKIGVLQYAAQSQSREMVANNSDANSRLVRVGGASY
jgi:hypothetical protein